MKDAITELNDWVDSRSVVRRVVLFFTLYLTWHSYMWATAYVAGSTRTGAEIGLVVAAVLMPITYLQKTVFDAYLGSRK